MAKLFIYLICIFPINIFASESIKTDSIFDFSSALLEQPKMSKVRDTSFIINKYIQENYTENNRFFCGGVSLMTPDQALKYAYETGLVKVVTEFGYTNNIEVYTPIRQLVLNPDRSAVFKGYYFVSSNR